MGGIGTDLRVSDPISLMEGTGTAPRGHGARVPGTGSGTGFQFGPSYDILRVLNPYRILHRLPASYRITTRHYVYLIHFYYVY